MKLLITYGTMTGNCQILSSLIQVQLHKNGFSDIEICPSEEIPLSEIKSTFEKYDHIFIGASTWGFGEFPPLIEPFVEELQKTDLSNLKFSIFSNGDTGYGDSFCYSGKEYSKIIPDRGGEVIGSTLMLDGEVDSEENLKLIQKYIDEIIGSIK